MRSFGLNYEVSLLTFGGDAVTGLDALADSYRSVSSELTLSEWVQRPLHLRYIDNGIGLDLSPAIAGRPQPAGEGAGADYRTHGSGADGRIRVRMSARVTTRGAPTSSVTSTRWLCVSRIVAKAS